MKMKTTEHHQKIKTFPEIINFFFTQMINLSFILGVKLYLCED